MFCVVERFVVMVALVAWVVLGLCGWFASLAVCCWLLYGYGFVWVLLLGSWCFALFAD